MIRRKGFRDKKDTVKITFVLPDDNSQVQAGACVVGDFNDWNPEANLLQKRSNQTHSTSVIVDKGKRYAYRYRTVAGEWFNVGDADAYETNEFGEENGILIT